MNDVWGIVASERRDLADLLEQLTPQQWAAPSLCQGWSVKDVGIHVMVGPTATRTEAGRTMLLSRGDVAEAMDRMVRERASWSTDQVVATLRERADSRFSPPVVGWRGPLTDIRVHTLDITVPLGIGTERSAEGWSLVLDFLVSRRARIGFVPGGRPALSYVAPDIGWSHGAGPRVAGPAADLALALCRRPAGLARLEGPGLASLTAWVDS